MKRLLVASSMLTVLSPAQHISALYAAESDPASSARTTPLVLAGEARCAIVAPQEDALIIQPLEHGQSKGASRLAGLCGSSRFAMVVVLEKDVIVSQATPARSHAYSEKITAQVLKACYGAAAWAWRRGDTEVRSCDVGLRG